MKSVVRKRSQFDPANVDGIAEARTAGRRAGRALKLKVITFQSDPAKREDGKFAVIVAVNQELPPEDRDRMDERTRLILNEVFKDLGTHD